MTAAKDKMKQRSFYMDDETYALIERHAERLGTSNGTALRMLVRSALLENPHMPEDYKQALARADRPHIIADDPLATSLLADAEARQRGENLDGSERRETSIILPPDTQETFKVPEKFREKGPRVPRVKHSDDDF